MMLSNHHCAKSCFFHLVYDTRKIDEQNDESKMSGCESVSRGTLNCGTKEASKKASHLNHGPHKGLS
jgi:hypothetical protein